MIYVDKLKKSDARIAELKEELKDDGGDNFREVEPDEAEQDSEERSE